ncbi:MAG: CoA ester lyase [Acidobacteria bacterium]|nr:CoA ester lyase [Acidobacteriota bacterium]
MAAPFRVRRSLLFVPAVRPDRYPKALATGADAVCIDLEDGVSFGAKDEARDNALALFEGRAPVRAEVSLRINDPKTELGQRDLDAVRQSGIRPDALMLPKCDGPDEIREVAAALSGGLPDLPLIVMLETARGVAAAEAIATAAPTVSAVFFGAIDFAADVGCEVAWDAALYARSRVIVAAAVARVGALDSPYMDVPALDALAEESRRTRALGFTGKAAIHPTQVPVIQAAWSPPAEEVAWARRIVEAYERNEGGVLLVDGKLIERPVIASAQRTLAMAAAVEPEAETETEATDRG